MTHAAGSPEVVLPIAVGDRLLAVDALCVVEILGLRSWVAIPRAPAAVPGAIAWRGRAIALLDLGPALGLPALGEPNTRNRNLVVRISDDTVALGADRVLETLRPSEAPTLHPASELDLPRHGELVIGDALVSVLDLERWVRSYRRSA
jgi:chemotaxis signal transduction protein